jgi:hypothetical protein
MEAGRRAILPVRVMGVRIVEGLELRAEDGEGLKAKGKRIKLTRLRG